MVHLVFIIWQGVVAFAIVTVIRGVFLHETFKVAQFEEEIMIIQKQRMMQKTKKHLYAFFKQADKSGDGFISYSQFEELAQDHNMKAWMAAMEIHLSDVDMVFALMDDNRDGHLSVEELLTGFSRLRGNATSVDLHHLKSMVGRLETQVESIASWCSFQELRQDEMIRAKRDFALSSAKRTMWL